MRGHKRRGHGVRRHSSAGALVPRSVARVRADGRESAETTAGAFVDLVGYPAQCGEIMAHHNDGTTALGLLSEQPHHHLRTRRVQVGGRLIGKDDLGMLHSGAGERDSLSLPTRETRRRSPPEPMVNPAFFERASCCGDRCPIAVSRRQPGERNLRIAWQGGDQVRCSLEHHGDPWVPSGVQRAAPLTAVGHRAPRRRDEAGSGAQESCLARTGDAEDASEPGTKLGAEIFEDALASEGNLNPAQRDAQPGHARETLRKGARNEFDALTRDFNMQARHGNALWGTYPYPCGDQMSEFRALMSSGMCSCSSLWRSCRLRDSGIEMSSLCVKNNTLSGWM